MWRYYPRYGERFRKIKGVKQTNRNPHNPFLGRIQCIWRNTKAVSQGIICWSLVPQEMNIQIEKVGWSQIAEYWMPGWSIWTSSCGWREAISESGKEHYLPMSYWRAQLVWALVPSTGICLIFVCFCLFYLLFTFRIWTWPLGIYSILDVVHFSNNSWHLFNVSLHSTPAPHTIPQREQTSTGLSPADSASNK